MDVFSVLGGSFLVDALPPDAPAALAGLAFLGGALLLAGRHGRRPPTAPTPPEPTVVVDGTGVRRRLGGGREEVVAWEALVGVTVLTTDEGPFVEDVWWLLHAADGSGVAVPGAEAGPLLPRLWRLPRVSAEAVIAAMGSTDHARFVVWTGAAGEGAAAGGEGEAR